MYTQLNKILVDMDKYWSICLIMKLTFTHVTNITKKIPLIMSKSNLELFCVSAIKHDFNNSLIS